MGSLKGIFIVSVILIALIAVLPKGVSLIEKLIRWPYMAEVSEAMTEIVYSLKELRDPCKAGIRGMLYQV